MSYPLTINIIFDKKLASANYKNGGTTNYAINTIKNIIKNYKTIMGTFGRDYGMSTYNKIIKQNLVDESIIVIDMLNEVIYLDCFYYCDKDEEENVLEKYMEEEMYDYYRLNTDEYNELRNKILNTFLNIKIKEKSNIPIVSFAEFNNISEKILNAEYIIYINNKMYLKKN